MNSSEYYSRGVNYKNFGYDSYNGLKDLKTYTDKSYELDQELLEQLNKNDFTEECNDIFECPICFKQSKDNPDLIYSRAKCKHVLCNDCWCGWFTEKFECPLCKKKARPKTLKRIIFTN